MSNFIKKNINTIIAIFILIQPILDLLTGLCLHVLEINLTIGIIVRVLFLLFIMIITIFIFKKKKIIIPYLIIGLYFIFYIIGIIVYKEGNVFNEIQSLVKVFYFPILFISLYSIKDKIRISKLVLFTTLFLYLIFIFIPLILGVGFKTYEITKAGTLGFFNSANEISGIISLLTPIMFIIFVSSKKIIPIIVATIIYLIVILMVGTKTPLLALAITTIMTIIYYFHKCYKAKKYKNILITLIILLISTLGLIMIIPKTNFYKNVETHLNYLELDSIKDVFKDDSLIDHFIFSQRLTFMKNKAKIYKEANVYQKIFGIGYYKDNKMTKQIEMDYFDIYYNHGIVGFLVFFSITMIILYKILENIKDPSYERFMLLTSLLLIIVLSLFTGHIITAPSVSLLSIIIIISLNKNKKKDLLFASVNLKIGGIEKAQINLLNKIDYEKYNVSLILEKKEGELLEKLNKNVNVKELKVSNHKNTIIRKITNLNRKLIFKIFNYQNYDFSCCYATYSYSCNKIAKIASSNNSFYVHSDYKYIYDNEKDFREFFDSRKVSEYKHIIFVSNEAKNSFLKYYQELENKTLVLNNFIDQEEIIALSKENVPFSKTKNKLFVFVGRLDDSSKKLKRAINLVNKIDNIDLIIVGDGKDRKLYEEYTERLKLEERVTFVGSKTNPYPYLKKADYIILTSDYEGFPVVYLEALVLKKQIITTINTSDELIDMKDYANIISKDEKKMVKEVKEILKENKKKEFLDIKSIEEKRIKKLEDLFNEVI